MAEAIKIVENREWLGYENFADPTNADIRRLQPGSQNVFIVDGDRLEVRAGIDYFGAAGTDGNTVDPYWTPAHRIHSKYDDFITNQGIKVPLRVFYSGTTAFGDMVEAWLPTNGDPSSTVKSWQSITANVVAPSTPIESTHRYFFDQWWDRINLISRTIFTVGNTDIWSWSGGFCPITGVTATTLTTNNTWLAKGFIDTPEGDGRIVVNGQEYIVTSGFGTSTVTLASTAGISVGDIAFSAIRPSDTLHGATTYDVVSVLNNQAYYIDWKQRNVYVSWNRNQDGVVDAVLTLFTGTGIDDGYFSGTYTDDSNAVFKAIITKAVPLDENDPTEKGKTIFNGNGANALVFDKSGYSSLQNNTYKVVVSNSLTSAVSTGSIFYEIASGGFTYGDIVTGGTSGATAEVAYDTFTGELGVNTIVGSFTVGETITGSLSGSTATFISFTNQGGYSLYLKAGVYKNGVFISTVDLQAPASGIANIGPFPMIDGLMFDIPQTIIGQSLPQGPGPYIGYDGALNSGDSWVLEIGARDRVTTYKNDTVINSNVLIPNGGGSLTISDGVSITFTNDIGHDVGDNWTINAQRRVRRGWTVFTYTQPGRLPGEGFTLLLDSNGWTAKPQEDKMYLNAQAGHYYVVSLQLSSDLLTEDLNIKRLKSEPQNKVLFPYLINYDKNQLAAISQDKTYDSLGRQELLELPQTKSISDIVRIDFETANWENGDFLYGMRKIFFSVPETGKMFIWDDFKQYWHSPMVFAQRVGLVSIIDGQLCGHSYEKNETYELFTGVNDLDIYPISTKMVFAYDAYGQRYYQKATDAIGFEGYVEGAPDILYTVNFDVGGCNGQAQGQILPVLCQSLDTASLGKGHLGFHGLGNDQATVSPHFMFIDTFSKGNFYLRNMEVECESLDQRWSLVSLGTSVFTSENNTTIVHRKMV